MQAIKEKLKDMSEMRKAKAEAKEEEQEERELAKARLQVAHEVRMAREAEAAMDLHVNKAAEKAAKHEAKHPHHHENYSQDPYGHSPSNLSYYSTPSDEMYGNEGTHDLLGQDTGNLGGPNTATGTGNPTNRATDGGPPTESLI